jgi:hypothetical protein
MSSTYNCRHTGDRFRLCDWNRRGLSLIELRNDLEVLNGLSCAFGQSVNR